MLARLTGYSRPILFLAAFALLIDLALTWRDAPVHTQYLTRDGGASALQGWGMLAGALLIAFLVAELVVPNLRKVLLAVAGAAAAATVVEFVTGSAAVVRVDGDAIGAVETTLWPAYAGLALASILVLATARRMLEPREQRLPLPPFRTEWRADPS